MKASRFHSSWAFTKKEGLLLITFILIQIQKPNYNGIKRGIK